MAQLTPCPSLREVRDTFSKVVKASGTFIPESAVFVLNQGKQAERNGKLSWLLCDDFNGPVGLWQGPRLPDGTRQRWTRRAAQAELQEILKAYRR